MKYAENKAKILTTEITNMPAFITRRLQDGDTAMRLDSLYRFINEYGGD